MSPSSSLTHLFSCQYDVVIVVVIVVVMAVVVLVVIVVVVVVMVWLWLCFLVVGSQVMKKDLDVNVSVNDLVIKSAALALRDVPEANAKWNKKEGKVDASNGSVDISVAVATPNGLITPIVTGADKVRIRLMTQPKNTTHSINMTHPINTTYVNKTHPANMMTHTSY